MGAAVQAYVQRKFGAGGPFHPDTPGPWKDTRGTRSAAAPHDQQFIELLTLQATYIDETFGKFPGTVPTIQIIELPAGATHPHRLLRHPVRARCLPGHPRPSRRCLARHARAALSEPSGHVAASATVVVGTRTTLDGGVLNRKRIVRIRA